MSTAPAAGPAYGADDGWGPGAIDALFDALLAFGELQDQDFFGVVVRDTATRLGSGLSVPRHAELRVQLTLLIETLRQHRDPDAVLHALAGTLRKLRGDTAAMARLDALVDELAPPGRLPGARLRAIVAVVDTLKRPVAPAEALARAAHPGEPRAVRGDESVAAMVRRLNDARDPADPDHGGAPDAPLVLRFLAELARGLPGESAYLLLDHVGLAADELGLPPAVRSRLVTRRPPVLRPPAHRVLQIRLGQTAPGKAEYEVEGVLFERTEAGLRGPRKRAGARTYGPGDLQDLGRTCLLEWEDLAAGLDEADGARVEFLLPWPLLGQPVERWLTDAHGYLLGHKYPVVVRSLDRMRQRSWRRDWERRWQALQRSVAARCAAGRVGWLVMDTGTRLGEGCEPVHVRGRDGEIRTWLDAHPDAGGMALAFAYDHHDARHTASVREAVCEGVPFMVWRRDDGDPAELALRLGESDRPGDGGAPVEAHLDLPALMRLWRRGADRDDTGDMHNHLTLFWDDPECVYRESALVAPGTPAGGLPPAPEGRPEAGGEYG